MAECHTDFAALLGDVTEQLRFEHQREVDMLNARIRDLRQSLASFESFPRQLSDEPVAEARSFPFLDADLPVKEDSLESMQMHPMASNAGSASSAAVDSRTTGQKSMLSLFNTRRTQALRVPQLKPRKPIRSGNRMLDSVERLVRSNAFDIASIALVILNTINLAVEAQYNGSRLAADLGYSRGHTSWVGRAFGDTGVFDALEMVFGTFFCVEISLRVVGLRVRFFKSVWNLMDLVIVCLWLFALHTKALYVITLARLHKFARLLRLFRLIRRMQGFDALFLMTTALKSSISILFWTICLLSVVVLFSALLLQQFLMEYYFVDTEVPASDRQRLFRYFGMVTTSLFSVFELMLGNFAPLSRELYELVGEAFIFITILFKVLIGFAVLGIINGVLIQETFKVAQTNDELIVRRAHSMSRVHDQKVRQLMKTVAKSDEKRLDRRQFRDMFEHPDLSRWLASMELVPADVDGLFEMMDNGDGYLTVDAVAQGFAKFKGSARTCDLHLLWRDQRELLREHRDLRKAIERHLAPHSAAPGQRGEGLRQEDSVPRMEEGVSELVPC